MRSSGNHRKTADIAGPSKSTRHEDRVYGKTHHWTSRQGHPLSRRMFLHLGSDQSQTQAVGKRRDWNLGVCEDSWVRNIGVMLESKRDISSYVHVR